MVDHKKKKMEGNLNKLLNKFYVFGELPGKTRKRKRSRFIDTIRIFFFQDLNCCCARRCDESEEEEEVCNVRLCNEWGRDSQRHLRNEDRER